MTTIRMETPVLYFYAGREMKDGRSVGPERGRQTIGFPSAADTDVKVPHS
jgi:hypothetical protein